MDTILPDMSTPFGERVARRLREEHVIWLNTTGADGTPQPNPVWFLWDGETMLIYSLPDAARVEHIRRNPKVSLNFNSNANGGDIVVITGEARLAPDDPSADKVPDYVEKYTGWIEPRYKTPEGFAARYSLPIRVTPTKVRGY